MSFEDWGESANDYSDPYDSIPFGDAQRWEDDRVAEDMALERADAQAEADAEESARLAAIVNEALAPFMLGTATQADIVEAVVDALVNPDPRCDICNRRHDDSPAGFADADWNPETGNHETCEEREAERARACDHPVDVVGCSECDWAMRRR